MTALFNRNRVWVFGIAILVGIGGILFGYDIGVISGALLFIKQSIPMSDTQLGWIVGAVLGGALVGTLAAGSLADKLGRRLIIGVSCIIFILGIFLMVLAHVFQMLLLARLLLGMGIGVNGVAIPLYVAELVPSEDRGKYVTFFQLFLTLGIVIAYFSDLLLTPSGNWRGMFALMFIPAIILLIGVLRLPETPRWLIANGKPELARRVLRRTHPNEQVESSMIMIYDSLKESHGTWRELFSPKLLLPCFIAISVAVLNQWTGINIILQYAPEILKRTGLGSNFASMLGSAGIGTLNFLCTLAAIFLVDRVGRRPLLLVGISGIVVSEIFLGWVTHLHLAPHLGGILSLMGLFVFIICFAIGPGVVVWITLAEFFPTRVRGKGIATCLFFNYLVGWICSSVFLDIVNHIGIASTYWVCAGFSFCYFCLAYFMLPETTSRSLEDIQQYFQNKVITEKINVPTTDSYYK